MPTATDASGHKNWNGQGACPLRNTRGTRTGMEIGTWQDAFGWRPTRKRLAWRMRQASIGDIGGWRRLGRWGARPRPTSNATLIGSRIPGRIGMQPNMGLHIGAHAIAQPNIAHDGCLAEYTHALLPSRIPAFKSKLELRCPRKRATNCPIGCPSLLRSSPTWDGRSEDDADVTTGLLNQDALRHRIPLCDGA